MKVLFFDPFLFGFLGLNLDILEKFLFLIELFQSLVSHLLHLIDFELRLFVLVIEVRFKLDSSGKGQLIVLVLNGLRLFFDLKSFFQVFSGLCKQLFGVDWSNWLSDLPLLSSLIL